ncbi:MAG: caspase family protein, partial [Spirochaetaceae bacterium]|nr:caspase family protein [Spirochaetaceae bacterium]
DLYLDVFERVLADKAVTKQNLLETIREFGLGVQSDDVFILYLAGHGITHSDGDYYFIPQDFKNNTAIKESGVSKWELISALSSVRAENITVILDTCNSASFGTEQPSEEQLLKLTKEAIIEKMGAISGFDLITACTSAQLAVEHNGHGVFTSCLIDGIKGAADLDQNAQITSAELATFVIKEVPIQTQKEFGYKQEPQRSQPKFDFAMFGKLNPLEGRSLKDALEIARLAQENGISIAEASSQIESKTTALEIISSEEDALAQIEADSNDDSDSPKREIGEAQETAVSGYYYDGENEVIIDFTAKTPENSIESNGKLIARYGVVGVEWAKAGKTNDEINIVNATHIHNMSVMVSGYRAKKNVWKSIGIVTFKKIAEDKDFDAGIGSITKKFQKISVKPSVSVPMRMQVRIIDEVLTIFLLSEETVDSRAFQFDATAVQGKFKDNVRFFSEIADRNVGFDLYAKKADDEPWQKVGVSFLKNFGDTDFCDSALANVAQYRYFAVLPHNKHDYRYSLSKKHNDLYITVLPK